MIELNDVHDLVVLLNLSHDERSLEKPLAKANVVLKGLEDGLLGQNVLEVIGDEVYQSISKEVFQNL